MYYHLLLTTEEREKRTWKKERREGAPIVLYILCVVVGKRTTNDMYAMYLVIGKKEKGRRKEGEEKSVCIMSPAITMCIMPYIGHYTVTLFNS